MATPRKNFDDLESPYAKHLPQYPSQSEGYLPLELGGPGPGSNGKGQSHNRNGRYTSTPAKYNHNRGGGGGRDDNAQRFGSGGGGGGGNFYQNRQNHKGRGNNRSYGGAGGGWNSYGDDNNAVAAGGMGGGQRGFENNYQRQPNRYSGFGSRCGRGGGGGGGGGGQHRNKNNHNRNDDLSQYFHASMLEDPWKELMERHNAICNSQIDLQPRQQDTQMQERAKSESPALESGAENDAKQEATNEASL